MATENPPVNGLYAAELPASTAKQEKDSPKADPQEIGWYFVEQYYTTLSKSPDRIQLFYGKKSQLVTGVEAEKVIPAVGVKAIGEKIKSLDIQDCKVRVLNVDSQASNGGIVIQVIGEMSNKSEPHHKFVQTFVLAEQPNGYYVLNDIFRYLNEDEDEIVDDETSAVEAAPVESTTAEVPVEPEVAPEAQHTLETVTDEASASQVDEKLEEQVQNGDAVEEAEPSVNGASEPTIEQANEPAAEPEAAEPEAAEPAAAEPESAEPEAAESEAEEPTAAEPALEPDVPAEPVHPPSKSPVKPATPAPVAEAAPVKKTWAMLAGSKAATPAIPNSVATTPAQAKAQKATQAPAAPKAAPQPIAPEPEKEALAVDEWQTADHGKKQNRPANNKPAADGITLAYIKNVNEKVDARILKDVLERHGSLKYFDVSRQRNCAFVEFADATGYNAAVAANPHQVGSEQIYVEERRPRPNAFGGNMNASRGGRGGFQRGGKGNMPQRGRGGATQGA